MADWSIKSGVLFLPNAVTVETVPALVKAVAKQRQAIQVLDFSQVTQADSVALAMVLHWQQTMSETLELVALPENLKTLVKLYDLEQSLKTV